MKIIITALAISFIANIAFAGSPDYRELDKICKKVRTEKIKVVQAQKVEECVNVEKKERDYCERYYKHYGWGNSRGGRLLNNANLFVEIPECIDAFNARKNRER